MVANLCLVDGMENPPCACSVCGGNPTDMNSGERKPAVFAPGVDIDWGGSWYLCNECAQIVADLMGRTTVEGFDKLTARYEALEIKYQKLVEENQHNVELIDKVRDGVSAQKEIRASETKTAPAAKR